MAFSSHTTGAERHLTLATFGAWIARFWHATMAKSHSALRALQTARMMSTLAQMSDHQLTQIGISRSEIPQYAEKLMAED